MPMMHPPYGPPSSGENEPTITPCGYDAGKCRAEAVTHTIPSLEIFQVCKRNLGGEVKSPNSSFL